MRRLECIIAEFMFSSVDRDTLGRKNCGYINSYGMKLFREMLLEFGLGLVGACYIFDFCGFGVIDHHFLGSVQSHSNPRTNNRPSLIDNKIYPASHPLILRSSTERCDAMG